MVQSLPKTKSVTPLTEEGKKRIGSVLERAVNDIEFRELLLANPSAALQDSGLTNEEFEVLSSMRRVKLEEWGVDVRRFRAWMRDNGNKISGF
jgi:hypothetical protein